MCFRFIRADLEPTGEYRWLDSTTKVGVTHKPTNTRLRVMSSNSKTAFGIVGCPLLVADEPGAWGTIGGQLMADAIITALGKPGSAMRVIFIGTLAPADGGWWHDMIEAGRNGTTHVEKLQGDRDKWDSWPEIRRVNPLTSISPEFRKRLRVERDAARSDTRLKARFLSYRLNVPTQDEVTMLLTVEDYKLLEGREAPERDGPAVVGLDLGSNRAFSAAVAVWANGRIEARAVTPGIPDIEAQERRDRMPTGTYQRLVDAGTLMIAEGLRVPPVSQLWESVLEAWDYPAVLVCDRFRLPELRDVVGAYVPIDDRITRWSDSSYDIRALRRHVKDGPFSLHPSARSLLTTSLSRTKVQNDSSGNHRLVKATHGNESRDDVSAALVLAAGAYARSPKMPEGRHDRADSGMIDRTGLKPRRIEHGQSFSISRSS